MSTDEKQELKPCPFCGRTDIERQEAENSNDETFWYIECQWCGASSGVGDTKKESITLWNDRVETAAPQWSQEVPTEEGWYWVKKIPKNSGVLYPEDIVYVSDAGGKFYVLQIGVQRSVSFHHFCHAFQEVLWCKIDEPPPLPTNEGRAKESTMNESEGMNDT